MPLVKCPDCGTEVSDQADACPKCARPMQRKIDETGAWCPKCGNRKSYKETKAGCLFWLIVLVLCLLPLIFYPFLPRVWKCQVCKNEWPA